MGKIEAINSQETAQKLNNTISHKVIIKEDDNIFATLACKSGMDGIASFLSDDWSANMARKIGWSDFADWIDNKEAIENPQKAKSESFISKSLRTMVKHPILTIASIATLLLKFLTKRLKTPFQKFLKAGGISSVKKMRFLKKALPLIIRLNTAWEQRTVQIPLN